MTNYENKEKKEYNHPYDKFSNFLDKYDFLEFLKEFRKRFMPMNIWMSLDDFIVFVYGKVENDFKIYCKDNNLSDKECDLLIRIESKDFWDKYIRGKTGLWTSTISAYHSHEIDSLFSTNSDK